jgi:hypothetical protein
MRQDLKQEIEEIIGQFECPKDFRCYKSGLEVLCKAKYIGAEVFLECLEEVPHRCTFSLFLGRSYLCQCPLRAYIAKELKK